MKASLKLSRDRDGQVQKQPIVKAKLPFDFLGFPVHAVFKVCGHIQQLALRISCCPHQEARPSLEVSYHPHGQDGPFTLSLKTGFSPWASALTSTFTMIAEVNLSRPSYPTFFLRVRPEIGDFSFRHDFRSEIRRESVAVASQKGNHMPGVDGSSSGMSFNNVYGRFASTLDLPDNACSPWYDSAANAIFDAGQQLLCDASGNASCVRFDTTPYASEKASYARYELSSLGSEHTSTPMQIFMEEKRFHNTGQHTSICTDWVPLRDNMSGRNPAFNSQMARMDDEWECVGDGVSRSTTSASSSTQPNRKSENARAHRHSVLSQSTSFLRGWTARGFCGGSHFRACTRVPISSEAHLKIRWSVSAVSSPDSKVPLLPLFLLDKVSLEALTPCSENHTPCSGSQNVHTWLPFSKACRKEVQPENVAHMRESDMSSYENAMEESMSNGASNLAVSESECKNPSQELHPDNVGGKKTTFLCQFFQLGGFFS